MEKDKLSLDVSSPDDVLEVLGVAADEFRYTASVLEESWQERTGAKPWDIMADELDRAADRIEKRLKKLGYPLR